MKRALVGIVLTACAVSAAPVATPVPTIATPVPAVATPVATPYRFRQGNNLEVRFVSFGADDLAAKLSAELPGAWTAATGGRSRVTATSDRGVSIRVYDGSGVSHTEGNDVDPNVLLYRSDPRGYEPDILSLVHELGHAMGCCPPSGHFSGEPIGLMTEPYKCRCPFTDRELRAMGLLR